jgi:hypothetical protein
MNRGPGPRKGPRPTTTMPSADDFLLLQGCLQALEDLLILLTSGLETH